MSMSNTPKIGEEEGFVVGYEYVDKSAYYEDLDVMYKCIQVYTHSSELLNLCTNAVIRVVNSDIKNYSLLFNRETKPVEDVNVDKAERTFLELEHYEVYSIFQAYMESQIIQEFNAGLERWVDLCLDDRLCFEMDKVYRVKPKLYDTQEESRKIMESLKI